ncbi:MAG: FeoA domain-containing protein [Anaerolineaceae bacterium]
MEHLGDNGIKPGSFIAVISHNPRDQKLQLTIGENEENYAIGLEIYKHIFVEII